MRFAFWRRERRGLGDPGSPLIPPRGFSAAGVVVTPDTALSLSAVWRCVTLRADLVSTLPLVAYRVQPDGSRVRITPPPILTQPSASMNLEEWLYASQVSLDLRGNTFGVVTARDGFGYPTSIELVNPDQVVVSRTPGGQVTYRVAGQPVASADMWHERQHVMPGEVLGLSPITYHARTLGVAAAAEQFGAQWFAEGSHPSGVLKTDRPVTQDDARVIKQRFLESTRGTREPAVLGLGLDWKPIQVAPNESQFLETMRYSGVQIARIFGVPPEIIGESVSGGSLTYANREQRALDFLTYSLAPVLARRERALSRLLPPRVTVAYDLRALLRTDVKTRYEAHVLGIAGKFLTPDEARAMEGEPPLTEEQKQQLELIPLGVSPTGRPVSKKASSGDAQSAE